MRKSGILGSAVLVLAAPLASAKTWTVGGTGADFSDLPAAIAAASDGDVILVRSGAYSGFDLDKGLAIVSSAAAVSIAGDVTIHDVAAPGRAVLRGFVFDDESVLTLRSSSGEIVVEEVTLPFTYDDTVTRVHVSDCSNVAFTDLDAEGGRSLTKAGPAVLLERSSVRFAQAVILGGYGSGADDANSIAAVDGGDALDVSDSYVVLNRPALIGGNGGAGDMFFCNVPDGANGGHGMVVAGAASDVQILGRVDHVVAGGAGGDGNAACGAGGDGGDGVHGPGVISQARLAGGTKGLGFSWGHDGSESDGKIQRDDALPTLRLDGMLDPGDDASFFLNAFSPSNVVLVLAEVGGFVGNGRFDGPNLSALPGGLYFLLVPGRTDSGGFIVFDFRIPNLPEAEGLVIEAQAAVLRDDGRSLLSNATARALGE